MIRAALVAALVLGACQRDGTRLPAPEARLDFLRDGRTQASLDQRALARLAPPVEVRGFDPYYRRDKRFRALPLDPILAAGFAGAPLSGEHLILRATDGYQVPLEAARLLGAGAYLAIEDLDAPGWEPIGPQKAAPGPYYLIWSGAGADDLVSHPRPWQLRAIEVVAFEAAHPHVSPRGLPERHAAWRGLALFRGECIRCHAINREGGTLGPDLNVPMSVVEYRPEAQLRAYIRAPERFRYGAMPAHPHLSDGDLDALLSYFRAMAERKHDPHADGGT
jgi:mono/diheme cytochrome c family protein